MNNNDNIETIELEELIAQTEKKIMDEIYYEDTYVIYKKAKVNLRIQPISQQRFKKITKNKDDLDNAAVFTDIIAECVLNKHNNKKFTKEQVDEIFTGGLALAVGLKCLEVSGINIDQNSFQ